MLHPDERRCRLAAADTPNRVAWITRCGKLPQQQQLAIARALCARQRLLILDEPTEGIQPSVIKDIARVIRHLSRDRGMAVVLVEQYYDFARELADSIAVMVRGEVALGGPAGELDEAAVRRLLTV
jgi:urea transport system ATP-binding protein